MLSADISGLQKPKSLLPTIKRIGEYLSLMQDMGRSPDAVTLTKQQYDAVQKVIDASEKSRDPSYKAGTMPLNYRGVPVRRAS